MTTMGPADAPLRRSAFASTDVDEVTDYFERVYVGNTTIFGAVHGPTGFHAQYADAGELATSRVRCSIDYRGSTEPWDFFCSFILDRGTAHMESGTHDLRLGPGDAMAYPLGQPLRFDIVHAAARVVRLPLATLEQVAESLGIGTGQLHLEGTRPVPRTAGRRPAPRRHRGSDRRPVGLRQGRSVRRRAPGGVRRIPQPHPAALSARVWHRPVVAHLTSAT